MSPHLVECIHPMATIYHEYCEIISSNDSSGKPKARLAVLSAYAESEGQTGISALNGLCRLKLELDSYLLDACHFSRFYQFVYFICRERGQKNMLVSTGIEAWRLVLTGRFRLLDQWCDFVKEHQRYTISEDTWSQVLSFSITIHEDLSNYDPEAMLPGCSCNGPGSWITWLPGDCTSSWPVLIDEFVEHMISQLDCQNAQYESVHVQGIPDAKSENTVDSLNSLYGTSAQAGCKKRSLSSFEEEGNEVESVNCIAQRLARMPSPLFSKRIRSSCRLSDTSESMEVN